MKQGETKNLGQIAAIWISSNAPENKKLLWYDTFEQVHKVYNSSSGEWGALNPQVVTNSTISALRNTALYGGLSIGKFYYLTDVGTLAVAITTTKIWYVDALNNYVVNDLAANITAYINSDNLLIDGSTGVWNNTTGRLEFKFSEVATGDNLQTANDYIVIRRKNGTAWNWVKAKLSGFVSAVSGNSISWNKGFYFNFATAVSAIKDRIGGLVGYDLFRSTIGVEYFEAGHASIYNDLLNISSTIQYKYSSALSYTDDKTSESALINKHIERPIAIHSNPPEVPSIGSTVGTIFDILFSWVKLLQDSSKIKVGSGFSPNGRSGNVNYSDTVRAAIEKLVYKIVIQSKADGITLPSGFNVNGRTGYFSKNDALDVLIEKILYKIQTELDVENIRVKSLRLISGFQIRMDNSDGQPSAVVSYVSNDNAIRFTGISKSEFVTPLFKLTFVDNKTIEFSKNGIKPITGFSYSGNQEDIAVGDTIEAVLEKLIYQAKQLTNSANIKLPDDFNPEDYDAILPGVNDNLTIAIGKLSSFLDFVSANLSNSIWNAKFRDDGWIGNVTVGDRIGEFDSQGRPLYTASLEGAVYLLGAWYEEEMAKRNAQRTYNAYYTSGRGDGRVEQNVVVRVKSNASGIRFATNGHLSFSTYQADRDYTYSYDSGSDVCLIIRDLPSSLIKRIGEEYGYAEPINTNIPIVAKWGTGLFAKGIMYAILVQPSVDSNADAYFKLMPYFTDVAKTDVEPGITYNNGGTEIIPTGSNKTFVNKVDVNTLGTFGSAWMANAGFVEEMISVTIPKFNFALSC